MSFIKRIATAAAGLSLVAAPIAASAAPAPSAAKLSLTRAGTASSQSSRLSGKTATFVNIGILAAIVVVVLVATGGDDDNGGSPNSP